VISDEKALSACGVGLADGRMPILRSVDHRSRTATRPHLACSSISVAVIIATYNQARFLSEAISSILAQTRPADEIVVVDDGSTDDPGAVASQYPGVKIICQSNRGRSAARNEGLRNCSSSHVVFLDADDRLLPMALELGAEQAIKYPKCGFVYGGHYDINEDGSVRKAQHWYPIVGNAHLALLRRNLVRMQATALFRRDILIEAGGYDEKLERAEDYDLYLRIAQRYDVAAYPDIIAEYRWHGDNTSGNPIKMLRAILDVLARHEQRIDRGASERLALREGRAIWRDYYAWLMIEAASFRFPSPRSFQLLGYAVTVSPQTVALNLKTWLYRRIKRRVPGRLARWINRLRSQERLPVGSIQFGDLRSLSPISTKFGFDRGTPIDRYYIERFLDQHADDVMGRVLEAGDSAYTRRFGDGKVLRSDVLHVDASNPSATVIGDLGNPGILPSSVFDCVLLTSVLHYVFDMKAAIASIHRALKPGGVLLLTVPGVSAVDDGGWGSVLAWSLTAPMARRLFEDQFDSDKISVEAYGNVFAATAFLHGIAVEEVKAEELNANDPRYPVVVAVRAVKGLDQ
jgi:glycosyltransferase involved in cell wall biosynthesis